MRSWIGCCIRNAYPLDTSRRYGFKEHQGHLNGHYPHFTQPTVQRLYDTVRSLKQWPHRGRTGREEGTRELVLASLPYILVYRVKEQSVEVLRICSTGQTLT